VTFTYPGAGRAALQQVNLTIRKGESVGIVGPSGSGKSTLVDVLLALIDPTSGRLTVDGRDVASAHRAWQRNIGYVAQSFYLLDDTLRRNIAFGVEADAVDEDRLRHVVRAARLDEVVASLPQGLDTVIGEGGTRLSGGERQRVAIARALYARPSVLILDEATAALDPLTEREVTDAIAAFRGTITMVVIAHRMSTVKGCDRLVMLRDGRVHAVGPYDELLESDDDFRALVTGEPERG
jgi:ATP-binding cassette subfamily C protein